MSFIQSVAPYALAGAALIAAPELAPGLFGAEAAGGAAATGLAADSAVATGAGVAATQGSIALGTTAASSGVGLGTILGGASLAGAGISALGQYNQGEAEKNAAAYQAQVTANNATIASQNAEQATEAGEANTTAAELKTRANVGAIEASQAGSGLDVNSGTNVDVRSSAAELGQLDALSVRSAAARTAYGFETQSQSEVAQGQLDEAQAKSAEEGGELGATGSLLSGASSAAKNYYGWQSAGGPSASFF